MQAQPSGAMLAVAEGSEMESAQIDLTDKAALQHRFGLDADPVAVAKALADSGLVEYEPRGGVRLTHGGEQLFSEFEERTGMAEALRERVS